MDLWYVNILLVSLANLYLMYRRVSGEPVMNQILYSSMNLPKLASQRLQTVENLVSGMTGHMKGLTNGYAIHYQYLSNTWRLCQTFQNRHIPGVFSKKGWQDSKLFFGKYSLFISTGNWKLPYIVTHLPIPAVIDIVDKHASFSERRKQKTQVSHQAW